MCEIQKGGIYKIREGKSYNKTEEILSSYIRVYDYCTNELCKEENKRWYILFDYIFKDTLNPTSRISPPNIIEVDKFLEYFELYMDWKEVNDLIFKLEKDNLERSN
ncbi:hypothetical protein [Clostridium botulinum]|uniref:hypothetical protein n=1 Tax=Clostridium botulinum TaxID=1491 RepID=UPI001C9B92E1|nr:hypothetical protein [Clostridium botulinum]MBY6838748.1 hypothetical protein [Clostridium botulinum]